MIGGMLAATWVPVLYVVITKVAYGKRKLKELEGEI